MHSQGYEVTIIIMIKNAAKMLNTSTNIIHTIYTATSLVHDAVCNAWLKRNWAVDQGANNSNKGQVLHTTVLS